MRIVVALALLGLLYLTYTRLHRGSSEKTQDLETVRRTPLPREVQLRAQAVTDGDGKLRSVQEISESGGLSLRQAEVAYELLRHGERLPEE